MSTAYGYFTSWWFWLFCPTLLVLVSLLLVKLCLDFPRLLCRCDDDQEKFSSRQVEEDYYQEEEEDGEEEEQIVVVGYRSIG